MIKKIGLLYSLLIGLNIIFMTVSTRTSELEIIDSEPVSSSNETYQIFLPIVTKDLRYFVSPNGSDSNPGTLLQPWKTIKKAARMVNAGYTIYLREGIYVESVNFTTSGTGSNLIKILAYPGENPVIDGTYSIPEPGGCLLCIQGDYILVSGIEVRNSTYMGILVQGNYDVVDNVYVHHCKENGILINQGFYSTVENSRVWRNAFSNEYEQRNSGASGLSAARNGVSYATIRGNTAWENWGEGISSFEANQVTIEDNISHDNWSANFYISDSTNVLFQRNLVYTNPNSYMSPYGSHVGILLGDEKYIPPSANITIINNIAYGNMNNLTWYRGVQGGGMNNVLISNNTFVNSMPNDMGHRNVDIGSGTHQNVRFMNNIIVQDGTQSIEDIKINPQVIISYNIWSKSPRTEVLGTEDIVADPLLSRAGDPYSPGWFRLTSLSPAIGKAQALPEVLVDYFNSLRDAFSDIGAIEFIP